MAKKKKVLTLAYRVNYIIDNNRIIRYVEMGIANKKRVKCNCKKSL